MPNDSHRLGNGPGRINIITFSGAHGVGKTTLVDDLKGLITTHPDLSHRVLVVPSVSTFWFKRCQEHCRAAGIAIPQTYDDINTMGYREKMQSEMPCLLANSVLLELNRLVPMGSGTIIVDRWFGDIATYTSLEIESSKAAEMNTSSEMIYQNTLSNLNRKANGYSGSIYLTHVFVPVASCKHEMPRGKTDDKAHRGTQAVDLWESTYARVNVFTNPRRTLVITAADRLQRAEEIISGAFG